jgi:hypothetical protein
MNRLSRISFSARPWIAALALLAFVPAVRTQDGPGASTAALEAARSKGREIVAAASGLLSTNLLQAIAKGGVTNAIEFCSLKALDLTRTAAGTTNVQLRRVTDRLRNPANAPDPLERRVLEQFLAQAKNGAAPGSRVTVENGKFRYFEPVLIGNPLCLNCHGEPGTNIQKETMATLQRLFPKDAATGYKLGDVRGLWSVTFSEPGAP